MLGAHSLLYRNYHEITKILKEYHPQSTQGTEYEKYADPTVVMNLFQRQFLESLS